MMQNKKNLMISLSLRVLFISQAKTYNMLVSVGQKHFDSVLRAGGKKKLQDA